MGHSRPFPFIERTCNKQFAEHYREPVRQSVVPTLEAHQIHLESIGLRGRCTKDGTENENFHTFLKTLKQLSSNYVIGNMVAKSGVGLSRTGKRRMDWALIETPSTLSKNTTPLRSTQEAGGTRTEYLNFTTHMMIWWFEAWATWRRSLE